MGRRQMLLELLEQRFGLLSSPLRERIKAVVEPELSRCSAKLLVARCLEDVLAND